VTTFRAIVINKSAAGQDVRLAEFDETDLMEGDVTVAVDWSTVNYKDGLALTGKAPVVRRFPMIPGIDFAGTIESSSHPAWKAGDKVVLNGWGLGETHLGAYAEKARVKGDWLVRLPGTMSTRDAMAIGTAGYTAMLAVMALEHAGVTPSRGPVVVTGAAGGVGSVAIAVLAKLGYAVTASTGRPSETDLYHDRLRAHRLHLLRLVQNLRHVSAVFYLRPGVGIRFLQIGGKYSGISGGRQEVERGVERVEIAIQLAGHHRAKRSGHGRRCRWCGNVGPGRATK